MGNVILDYKPEKMTRCYTDDEEAVKILTHELFSNKEWILLDEGLIDESQAYKGICKRIPERLYPLCAEILMTWHEHFLPIESTYPVVKELKDRGYKLYTLTNAAERFRVYYLNNPAFELMDGFVVSAEEKLLKPDRRIYQVLLDRYNLKAEECFFIDDSAANIEGAAKLGIRGLVFDGDPTKILDAVASLE